MDFEEAERRFAELKSSLDAGTLSPSQFQTRLRELAVTAADGTSWTLGAQTGRWYFFDGTSWVQGEPPRTRTVVEESGCARCGQPVEPGRVLCDRCDETLGAPLQSPPAPPPLAARATGEQRRVRPGGQGHGVAVAIVALILLAVVAAAVWAALYWHTGPLSGLLTGLGAPAIQPTATPAP